MRLPLLLLLAASATAAPVPEEQAKEALAKFREAFAAEDTEAKQAAVYALHDVPHDMALRQLERLLKHKDPAIRNVAALSLGGQCQDSGKAGDLLLKAYRRKDEPEEVLASILEAMTELRYMGYWPDVKAALKDERSVVVVATLALLGENKDWRALPDLVDLYREVMPRRITWHTGEVVLPDGTDEEAKAKWEAKYGVGGAKEKAKAKAKAASFDRRNFSPQIRACVKRITGKEFENAFVLEEWWAENYVMVAGKIAEMEGKDPASAAPRAKIEQAELRAKVEEERKQIEEDVAKDAADRKKEKG